MPDLIRHPVPFRIALMLHYVPRLRGNDNRGVFNCRSNKQPRRLLFLRLACEKFISSKKPPSLVEDPDRFYRPGERSTDFALYQTIMK